MGIETISRFGNEEQKTEYIPKLASGKGIAAWALTEPDSGSDAAAMSTTATHDNGFWVLNGSKQFITNANVAETVIVFATLNPLAKHNGICAFIVPVGTHGMTCNVQGNKMGLRSSNTCEILFNDVKISSDNLIGEAGMGFKYAMDILSSSRISIAAQCVGIGQAALEEAVKIFSIEKNFWEDL